jgi:hypothetical protein
VIGSVDLLDDFPFLSLIGGSVLRVCELNLPFLLSLSGELRNSDLVALLLDHLLSDYVFSHLPDSASRDFLEETSVTAIAQHFLKLEPSHINASPV